MEVSVKQKKIYLNKAMALNCNQQMQCTLITRYSLYTVYRTSYMRPHDCYKHSQKYFKGKIVKIKTNSWNHSQHYYSFKIILHFWYAKLSRAYFIITSYILSTKFGRILPCEKWCQLGIVQQNCQIIEPLTEKTWGRGWVVIVVTTKWRNISLVGSRWTIG